jgi:hypothetical protein
MYTNREGDSLFLPFCTIGISMDQISTLPYTLFLTYLPQAYSPLERYGLTDKVLHPLFPEFSFSLSARGPTRRRNFTGLAELWGGWPIEQVKYTRWRVRRAGGTGYGVNLPGGTVGYPAHPRLIRPSVCQSVL